MQVHQGQPFAKLRTGIAIVLIASGLSTSTLAQTEDQTATKPEHAGNDRGRVIYGEACLQCHFSNQVMLQRKTPDGWLETVYTMIARGAQVIPEDIEPLVAFLSDNYGPEAPVLIELNEVESTRHLPAGQGRSVAVTKCGQCHSLAMIVDASKAAAEWRETIDRMVSYGAVLSPEEVKALMDYFVAHYGAD